MDWNDILKYIKNRLALPSAFIEKSDSEIIDYLKENTLREFSVYFPDVGRTIVYVKSEKHKHPKVSNWFYFFDDENLEILSIKQCYFEFGDLAAIGHPIIPPLSLHGIQWWALDVLKATFLKQFSPFQLSYKFIPPNIVEMIGLEAFNSFSMTDKFLVEYERVQPPNLSKIPPSLYIKFRDLCLADMMILIGTIRSMYGDGRLTTPFGEIPLNGSELLSRGESLKDTVISSLTEEQRPPVIIDVI